MPDPFDYTAVYVPNDEVTYGGQTYRAANGTRGVVPPAYPWQLQSPGTSGPGDQFMVVSGNTGAIANGGTSQFTIPGPADAEAGTDITLDTDAFQFATAGRYTLYAEFFAVTADDTMDGLLTILVLDYGGTTVFDNLNGLVRYNVARQAGNNPLVVWTLPDIDFEADGYIGPFRAGFVGTGEIDNHVAGTFYVRRTA